MLKSIRNSLVLTSLLYVILGLLLILLPGMSLSLACTLIGAVTLGYGAVRILSTVKGGETASRFDLFVGVALALLGVFLLLCPQLLVSLIPIALGVYIMVDSFSAVKRSWDLKTRGYDKWWISFAAALVLALFGLVMVLRPFLLLDHLVIFIGVGFLFDGVFTLAHTLVAERVYRG